MAKPTVYISRSGMTPCPECGSHFRVKGEAQATCPFCATEFNAVHGGPSALSKVVSAGRSGLLAASLFGVTTLGAACSDDDDPEPDASMDVVEDSTGDTMEDSTEDTADTSDTSDAPDLEVQPPYGIPADMVEDQEMDSEPQPAYGIPADMIDAP